MALQKLPAIFITDEHLLIGEVQTRGLRLLEMLIDPHSEYVYLNDVNVARRESKASRLTTLTEVVVRKNLLRLAVLGGGKHEAPETRRFAFVDKQNYPAFAIVSGYALPRERVCDLDHCRAARQIGPSCLLNEERMDVPVDEPRHDR